MTQNNDQTDTAKIDLPGIDAVELERVARPLESAWTLPPTAYTSPDVYALEKETLLKKSWIPIGRIDQVPNPCDFLTFTLFDQPLLLVHGQDGEIRVMSRVCLHRAAPIVEGSGNRKLFTCPYHAWSYGTDGGLVRAPYMEGAEDFSEKCCRLPQLRMEIWKGFVFVNFDDGAKPLVVDIEAFSKYIENYRLDDLVIVETLTYDNPWNWKVLVENFMEAYHHIATHSTTFEPTYHAKDSFIPDALGPYSILHMPTSKAPDHTSGFPIPSNLSDSEKRDLLATVIFPCFLLGLQGEVVVWYQVTPLSHDQLDLKIHLCVQETARDLPNLKELIETLRVGVDFIHQEDIHANDLVWQGLKSPLAKQGRLSLLEKSIWQMNQWWLSKMSNRPK